MSTIFNPSALPPEEPSFIATLAEKTGSAVGVKERVFPILERALGEKQQLYECAIVLLGDRPNFGEAKQYVSADSIPKGVVNKIEYIKKLREREPKPKPPTPEERADIIRLIQESAEEISGLAGQFRSAVALFKAENPFF
jgi:hypothetical protein